MSKSRRKQLKSIVYRGGVVTFELPTDWFEEYEPSGGGTFYENRPNSGTLRLHVLEFSGPPGTTIDEMLAKPLRPIRNSTEKDAVQEMIQDDLILQRYMKLAEENGEALHLYRWEVHVPVLPRTRRIVCYTHTIVAGQESTKRIADEIEMIDTSVRKAIYSREVGVVGEFTPHSFVSHQK